MHAGAVNYSDSGFTKFGVRALVKVDPVKNCSYLIHMSGMSVKGSDGMNGFIFYIA
jgi:hypothetical protein